MGQAKRIKAGFYNKSLYYLPLMLGMIFMLVLILHFGINVPSEDQWEMVPLFQHIDHHTLSISDLWHQHNEHRIFFPLIVLLINAYATHWNTVTETIIGFVFASLSAFLIFLMLSRQLKRNWVSFVAAVLISAWFFSPIQWGNWLWGWQLEWFMCVFGVILTLFVLLKYLDSNSRNNRRILFGIASLSAFITTFCLASGLFAWVIGLFILIVAREKIKYIIAWAVLFVLSTLLYYYHYVQTPTPTGSPLHVAINHPYRFAEFFVAFLGAIEGSINSNLQTPDIIGAVLLLCLLPLLYLVWLKRKNIRLFLPWLSLILLSLLAALSTAYGRLGYGINFALNSRYTAFSLLFVIGLIGLAFTLLVTYRTIRRVSLRVCVWSLVLLSLPLLISSYAAGIHGLKMQNSYLKIIKTCTHASDPTNACLLATYPNASIARTRLEYLKQKHWGGY